MPNRFQVAQHDIAFNFLCAYEGNYCLIGVIGHRKCNGGLQIDHDSQVVVYGIRLSETARMWWTLKYLGVQDVMILDGGWNLWVKEKGFQRSEHVIDLVAVDTGSIQIGSTENGVIIAVKGTVVSQQAAPRWSRPGISWRASFRPGSLLPSRLQVRPRSA